MITLVNEFKLIKALVLEAGLVVFVVGDFLEQFLVFLTTISSIILAAYFYSMFCATLLSEITSGFLFAVVRSVLFSYSTLEVLFLRKFVPYFMGSLVVVFLFNLVGMLPMGFTFTSSVSVPFYFGLVTFFLWFFQIFIPNPVKAFKYFLHNGTNFYIGPLIAVIEIISNFSKFISLSVRLFANMFAGHLLLKAFYSFIFVLSVNASLLNAVFGFFVIVFTLFITALEFLIAFLQAYVALLLIVLYISGVRSFAQEH